MNNIQITDNSKIPRSDFPDCIAWMMWRKKLSEHFVTIQEKDVIANRVMDEYEISIIRANYGEIAEEQIPELERPVWKSEGKFNAEKKDFEAKISGFKHPIQRLG